MNKIRFPLVAWIICALGASCSHKQVKIDSQPLKAGAVSMRFNWIKNKGKKYDTEIVIANRTDDAVLFYLGDMDCYKGTTQGTLAHTFFNTGHRTFKFHPGEQGQYRMVCTIGDSVPGDYKIVLHQVFENPNGDGKTAGKKIADNIEVAQPAPKE